ncbi:MAG: tetratricopeptide repeat protein [Candidatus Acidiferrum sp.]
MSESLFLGRGAACPACLRKIVVAFAGALAMMGPASPPSAPLPAQTGAAVRLDAKSAFENGQAALQAGDLDGAEKSFRQVLALDPRSAAAYANLGVVAMRRKDWDGALKLLKKAEQLDVKMAGIRLNIGLVEFRRENYAAAIAPLSSVLRDQPDSEQARYLLGLCQVLTEHYGEAVTALEPLWRERSGDLMYLYVLGMAAHSGGNTELDEKALARMIELGGDSPELHLILGKAYLNRQENDKAVSELKLAATGNPRLPFVHFNLGLAQMRMGGEDDLAETEFLQDAAIEPDLADDYEQLGILYAREHRTEEAEKAFSQALERDPRMAAARFGLAQAYFDERKFAAALREADTAAKLAPESQNVHYLRARILGRLGRAAEAKTEMARTQKLMNQSLGKARADLGDAAVPNPELTREPH